MAKAAINTEISDLFFNTDQASAKKYEINPSRTFVGYDTAVLIGNATAMLECLERLGVEVPTADELVQDFLDRQ